MVLMMAHSSMAIQIMISSKDEYCFKFNAEPKTVLTLDYQISGVAPDKMKFQAIQKDQVIRTNDYVQHAEIEIESQGVHRPIDLCW